MQSEQDPAIGEVEAPASRDWGNVRFRGRRTARQDDDGVSLFYLGLSVFLFVAFAYPWYSYWVSAFLLKRDVAAAAEEIGAQASAASRQFQQSLAREQAAQAEANRERSEQQRWRDVQTVQLLGVSAGGALPTVLVDFGRSNVSDAGGRICELAGLWLKRNVSGQSIRLRRYQGSQPAAEAGQLACP